MALTFFVQWRLAGGALKARYFPPPCGDASRALWLPGRSSSCLPKEGRRWTRRASASGCSYALSRTLAVGTEVRKALKVVRRVRDDEVQNVGVLPEHARDHQRASGKPDNEPRGGGPCNEGGGVLVCADADGVRQLLGAGSTVRESDTGNLDDLPVLLNCQLAAPLHHKLGRTIEPGQVHGI